MPPGGRAWLQVFVANPTKPDTIKGILISNREKLLRFLTGFLQERGAALAVAVILRLAAPDMCLCKALLLHALLWCSHRSFRLAYALSHKQSAAGCDGTITPEATLEGVPSEVARARTCGHDGESLAAEMRHRDCVPY
jgi:Mo25-like